MSREHEIPETPAVRTWYVGTEDSEEPKDGSYTSPEGELSDDTLVVGQDVEEPAGLASTDAIAGQIDSTDTSLPETMDTTLQPSALAESSKPELEDIPAGEPEFSEEQVSEEEVNRQADTLRSSIFPKLQDKETEPSESATEKVTAEGADELASDTKPEEPIENTATRRLGILRGKPEEAPEEETPNWSDLDQVDPPKPRTQKRSARQRDLEDTIFEGATVKPTVPSRLAAHLWTLLLALVFTPIAWYLLMDGATRMLNPEISAWALSSSLKTAHLTEFLSGLVVLFALVWMARYSSVGAFFTGIVLTVVGAPFIFLPGKTHNQIQGLLDTLQAAGESGRFYQALPANVAHHIETSGSSGLLLVAGIVFLALGLVSHGARRKGRKDFLIQKKVEQSERHSA